jgi:hypothetical protein
MTTIKSNVICDHDTAHGLSCFIESTLGSDNWERWTNRFTVNAVDFIERGDALFLRYKGINLEPPLAWRENGRWHCSNYRVAQQLSELTGLEINHHPC